MDDLVFAKRCVKADKAAWKEFLQKYSRLIYSYIYSTIRIKGYVFDHSVVEEIFSEIISLLIKDNFKKLKTYQGRNNATLASWLRQVSINFCLDYLRKQKPALLSLDTTVGDGLVLSEIIPYRSLGAAEELIQKEKSELLTDCIERLELDDKFFLELNLRWQFSFVEIKDFFDISRGALDMRRVRIIQKLRDCFKKKGFELPE